MVLAATVLPMALGAAALKALANPKTSAISIASWAALVFSIAGAPSGYIASQDVATGMALGLMHVVAGTSWFVAVRSKG
jgi:hypothetical protein